MSPSLVDLIALWKNDATASYQNWFLWNERLKNFRSIKAGIRVVIEEISDGSFGNLYRGSTLETVVSSISEQKMIFKGADHAFLWKPKLRIPDIYENRENQTSFGNFLDTCLNCASEIELVEAIHRLNRKKIKGLGPASANLLYFLHPTQITPFNTAIVKGYNELTHSRVKLGDWEHYLAMRKGILEINSKHQNLFSNDLGAVASFLFDLGKGKYTHLSQCSSPEEWSKALEVTQLESEALLKRDLHKLKKSISHTEVQGRLRDLGLGLGFKVWIAINDQNRSYKEGKLGDLCMTELPIVLNTLTGSESIPWIDVLWFDKNQESIVAAFEVEHSTSIYSGILRLLDLQDPTLFLNQSLPGLYLVIPDEREVEVQNQLTRNAFQELASQVGYFCYSDLQSHFDSILKFGSGMKAIESICKR